MDFAVSVDNRVQLKEKEKKDKYSDLARELKKLWNVKVTLIRIVVGAPGTITKRSLKGLYDLLIRRRVGSTQTTAFLRLAKYLKT